MTKTGVLCGIALSFGSLAHADDPRAPTDAELLEEANKLAGVDEPATTGEEVITIQDTAPAEAASSVHFSQDDLRRRPAQQPSDILRQTPGLVVAQHAGGGKADQYFLRGF